jgi:filamentous hemagglutinin
VPLQARVASGVGYGAIGGAASAALSPDLLKAIDPTGAALSPGQQAAMAGFATLLGGGLAGLAGANAQGGALAAQNEVLNNTDKHPDDAAKNGGAVTAFLGMLASSQQQANSFMDGPSNTFQSYLDAVFHTGSPQQPQDPSGLGSNDGTNNTLSTGAAPVTTEVCIPGEGCIVTPSLVPTGSPNNTPSNILQSTGNGDNGSGTTVGQGGTNPGKIVIDGKIAGQLEGRGWTTQDVQAVIDEGPVGTTTDNRSASKTPDGLPRNDSASVYGSKSGYVIVNDRTGEVVQVSGKNDPGWIPDSRIKWK